VWRPGQELVEKEWPFGDYGRRPRILEATYRELLAPTISLFLPNPGSPVINGKLAGRKSSSKGGSSSRISVGTRRFVCSFPKIVFIMAPPAKLSRSSNHATQDKCLFLLEIVDLPPIPASKGVQKPFRIDTLGLK